MPLAAANDAGAIPAAQSAAHTVGYKSTLGDQTCQLGAPREPSSAGGATGNPEQRGQFTLDYDRGPLDVTGAVNHTSRLTPTADHR